MHGAALIACLPTPRGQTRRRVFSVMIVQSSYEPRPFPRTTLEAFMYIRGVWLIWARHPTVGAARFEPKKGIPPGPESSSLSRELLDSH